MIAIFCLNRFLLAFSTVFFNHSTLPCVYILIFFSSIFQMAFHLEKNPMDTKTMNNLERTNLLVIYLTSYYLLIFTPWIQDVETIYDLGFVYLYFIIAVLILNISLIFYELYKSLRKIYRKRKYIKKWQNHISHQNQLLIQLVKSQGWKSKIKEQKMIEKYKDLSIFTLKKKISALLIYQSRDHKIQIGIHSDETEKMEQKQLLKQNTDLIQKI